MTEHPVPGGESSVEEVGDDSVIGDVLLALLTNIHTYCATQLFVIHTRTLSN